MPSAVRSALRIAGWNAALVLAGLALVAVAGETWLRLTTPSFTSAAPSRFAPGVGVLFEPHAEVRYTNGLDFWTVQRANSLGFLDREPPDPARAAASCHVAVIGDSFVAAREVAIADKAHVRLEALAAAALPELDVTTSAYGRRLTGQAAQLAFHDAYARRLRPNLVALVFVDNDFLGNSPVMMALRRGWDPDRTPYASPARGEDGAVRLRPPDPGYAEDALPWFRQIEPSGGAPWYEVAARPLTERSLFLRWLGGKRRALTGDGDGALPPMDERTAALAARPGYGWILDGWRPPSGRLNDRLLSDDPPAAFAEAREFTAWALAEFRRRADRGGAALAVLAAHTMGGRDAPASVLLRSMADPLGVPVINQHDWIARAGGRIENARWPHDTHWSPQGHQWAAEALLDWLRRHPEVCDDRE